MITPATSPVTDSAINFKAVFEAMPGTSALVLPDAPRFTILAVTAQFEAAANLPKNEMVSKGFFEPFPPNPEEEIFTGETNIRASFLHVLEHRAAHELPVQRYDIANEDGTFSELYWKATNQPVLTETGEVLYILHTAVNITDTVKGQQQQAKLKSLQQVGNLFSQAPVAIAVLTGPDLVVELANEPIIEVWGKGPDIIGKPILQVLPEIKDQGFKELMVQVMETGVPFEAYEAPVRLVRKGIDELTYFNFVYQPYYDSLNTKPVGIMIFASEATEQVTLKTSLTQNEQSLRLAIEIGELGVFTVNLATNAATYSPKIMEWFGLAQNGLPLTAVFDKIAEADKTTVTEAINATIAGAQGGKHDLTYRVQAGNQVLYLRSVGQVSFQNNIAVSISGIIQNVTAQTLSRLALEESKNNLAFAIDAAELATWDFNPIANTFTANRRYSEWFGLPAATETNNDLALRVIADEDRRRVVEAYTKALDKNANSPYNIEYRIRPQGLPERILHAKGKVYFNEDGTAHRFTGTLQDVTTYRRANEAVTESKELFAAAIRATEGILWTNNASGQMEGIQEGWAALTGQAFEEYQGYSWATAVHPDDVAPTLAAWNSAVAEKKPFVFEHRVKKAGGAWGDFSIQAIPLSHPDGAIRQWVGVHTEITRRKQTETALRESEQRFQNLIREATVGIIVLTGEEMKVEIVNAGYARLIGRTPEDLLHKNLFEIIPETEEYFRPIIEAVRTSGEPSYLYGVHYSVAADGGKKEGFLNVVYQPYREASGITSGVMVLCQDVTDQVTANKKLEESEQQIRSLVESAPFPIGVYTGREMRIQLANSSIIETWGKGPDVIGKRFSDILPELINGEIFQQLDHVYTTGKPFHARNQRVDLEVDGKLQPYFFNYSFTPLFDATGAVYGVMNTAADVTDLNLAQLKLAESETNLRNMILQAPLAICIFSGPEFVFDVVNVQMAALLGRPALVLSGQPFFEVMPEVRNNGLQQLLEGVMQSGNVFKSEEQEFSLPRNKGVEAVYVTYIYQPMKNATGVTTGIMVVATDVTPQVVARRKIEEVVAQRTKELAEVNYSLKQNNQELEQFAYIASHDLQEPLRKVTTFTEMLKENLGPVDERSATYLSKITASTTRMLQLIRDVLNLSQLSKDRDVFEPVNLAAVVESITSDFELLIEQKEAVIIYSGLPVVAAVPLQMQQLFGNLISNALKFSKANEAPVITITAAPLPESEKAAYPGLATDKTYSKIEVKDNGIGFRQEYAQQIFAIFQRLHGRTDYAGTGIGLALCKKIAQNHQGDIWVTSSPGNGSTFYMLLPVANE